MPTMTSRNAMATGPGGIPLSVWNLPALAPPEGRVPNFDHPESRATELIILNTIFIALTALAVIVRFIARRDSKDVVGWDGCTLHCLRLCAS